MKARVGAILMTCGLLALCAPLAAMQSEGAAQLPVEVKASGDLVIDRTTHAECLVAAPQILNAKIDVVVNTVTGTVAGTIGNGTGSGNADLLVCGDDNNKRYIFDLEFTGIIEGSIDTNTGRITADDEGNVSLTVTGTGEYGYYPDMPEWSTVELGGGFVCGLTDSSAIVSSCPLATTEGTMTAKLEGSLTPAGELTLELDWVAPYCELTTRDPTNPSVRGSEWLPESCPRKGTITWTNIVVSNQRPVIESATVDPAEPVTTDTVVITVSASDPDGDELTYQWDVDGERQQTIAGPSATWSGPTEGSHTIEVRVIDPAGGYDEIAIDVFVGLPSDDRRQPDESAAGETETSTTTSTTSTTVVQATGEKDKTSKGKAAGGAAVLAATIALAGDALRKGHIRGKAGELYRWGKKKADRGRELAEKAERAQAVIADPTILLQEQLEKKGKRLKESKRVQRAQRRFDKAQRKFKKAERFVMDPAGTAVEKFRESRRGQRAERRLRKAEAIVSNPLQAALERLRESRRGRRLERRGRKIAGIAADPYGSVDRAVRKKMKEFVSRLKARARKRALESGANRRIRRRVDRWNKHTKGILNAESTVRLIRAMGNPRRFSREVRRNPALVRHVIRRAGLSPLAVEALGGHRSIGRMLGRVARNPGRELRRVGRFLGRPKGWLPEAGRGIRRVGRAVGRIFGL